MIITPQGGVTKMKVVLLHGYGSCGADMMNLAQALALPGLTFWCPDGPEPCTEYPSGRQWFSLQNVDWGTHDVYQAWQGIAQPLAHAATALYTQDRERWDQWTGPMVVGGFSQGAMMAYELGFFGPKVQAVMGFSGVYCLQKPPKYQPDLWWTHAQDDPVIHYAWMQEADALLARNGLRAKRCVTPQGGHGMMPESISATRTFLQKLLNKNATIENGYPLLDRA